jgi:hypothetical protein
LPEITAGGKLSRLTLLDALLTALLTAVAILYEFPPPMVFTGLAFAFFAASLWRQRVGVRD